MMAPHKHSRGPSVESLATVPSVQGTEDWFSIDLNAGDTLVVDLLFDQLAPESDLDLYLYAPDGQTNLTPCCDVEMDNRRPMTKD